MGTLNPLSHYVDEANEITAEVRLRLWLQIRLFFCLGAEDIFSHIPSIRNPTLQSHSFLDLTI